MKILITGATGFIGKKLLEVLDGYDVYALVRDSKEIERATTINIANKNFINELHGISFDYFIHMATCYGRNNETRAQIFEVNSILPQKIFRHLDKENLKGIISLDSFYSFSSESNGYMTDYIDSKVECRKKLSELTKPYSNIRYLNLVLHHVFGDGDSDHKFVSWLDSSIIMGSPLALSDGKQNRRFIYVDDVANGIEFAIRNLESLQDHQSIQLYTTEPISMKDFICLYADEMTNKGFKPVELNFGQIDRNPLDSIPDIDAPDLSQFGWASQYTLQMGIKKTIDINHA